MGLLNFGNENNELNNSGNSFNTYGNEVYHAGDRDIDNDGQPCDSIDYEDFVDIPQTTVKPDATITEEINHDEPATTEPTDQLKLITDRLNELSAKTEEYISIINSQNQIISEQSRQLEQRNGNMAIKPLLLQVIDYADRLQEILNHDDSMVEKQYDHLDRLSEIRNDIEVLQQTIVSNLENHQVYQFRDTDENPLEYDRERQLLKDREESSNENEFIRYGDGVTTFYRSIAPGYLTTAEKQDADDTDSILRREEVVKITFRQ